MLRLGCARGQCEELAGQLDAKGRALPGLGLAADGATVGLDDLAGHRETKTGSVDLAVGCE